VSDVTRPESVGNRPRIPAAVLDSGLASAATFLSGLFAARTLSVHDLGTYALVFAAFSLAALIPTHLLFAPFEVEAVTQPMGQRLKLLRISLPPAVPIGLCSAATLGGCVFALPPSTSLPVVVALISTGFAASFVSPIQDHLRRMFHLDGGSWRAAVISAIHLGIVAATLILCVILDAPPAWAPLGALALGNAVSITAAFCFVPARCRHRPERAVPLPPLLRTGLQLLLAAIVPSAATFLAAAVVARVAGAAVLGYAEASRLVAQPIFVFSVALGAVLGPQSVEAARRRSPDTARRISREYRSWLLGAGLVYVLVAGSRSAWNPLVALLPKAFVVAWLVPVAVLANLANGIVFPQRSELLGAGRATALLSVEMVGNVIRIMIASAAATIGAFAIPVGLAVLGLLRWPGYRWALRGYYGTPGSAALSALEPIAD
jgi:hypothetical protein